MHGTTCKFHSSLDANWQQESPAQSSSHSRAIITFCWNKIRQRSAFSKRSICSWGGRLREPIVRFGSEGDIGPRSSDVRFASESRHSLDSLTDEELKRAIVKRFRALRLVG